MDRRCRDKVSGFSSWQNSCRHGDWLPWPLHGFRSTGCPSDRGPMCWPSQVSGVCGLARLVVVAWYRFVYSGVCSLSQYMICDPQKHVNRVVLQLVRTEVHSLEPTVVRWSRLIFTLSRSVLFSWVCAHGLNRTLKQANMITFLPRRLLTSKIIREQALCAPHILCAAATKSNHFKGQVANLATNVMRLHFPSDRCRRGMGGLRRGDQPYHSGLMGWALQVQVVSVDKPKPIAHQPALTFVLTKHSRPFGTDFYLLLSRTQVNIWVSLLERSYKIKATGLDLAGLIPTKGSWSRHSRGIPPRCKFDNAF